LLYETADGRIMCRQVDRLCWRGCQPPETWRDMEWCTVWLFSCAVFGIVGWALALSSRRRASRYRAAFDRAFAIARRVYHFTDDEKDELTHLIGEPIEAGAERIVR